MSRDFELLRKAEFREKSTVKPTRRETTSEFSPPFPDFPASAGQSEKAVTRDSEYAKVFAVIRNRWRLISILCWSGNGRCRNHCVHDQTEV